MMGCTVKEKHLRANRKHRSPRANTDSGEQTSISKSILESGFSPLKNNLILNDSSQNPNSNSIPNPNPNSTVTSEEPKFRYYTEEQFEAMLLKKLDCVYNKALTKLIELGYDKDVALKAVLQNGHCYGGMDLLTNILHNALGYLKSKKSNMDEPDVHGFSDLRQLMEYSLARMLYLLKQVRPSLSRGEAMWCLVMSDFHVVQASTIEIPKLPAPRFGCPAPSTAETVSNLVDVLAPSLYKFHEGWGFGNGGGSHHFQRDIELPKRFNLSPSLKLLLKRNVAMFAAGFRANSKQLETRAKNDVPPEQSGDSQNLNDQDAWNKVLSEFRDLNLNEIIDNKDEVIFSLFLQIKEFEKQVKERKDWAHEKAVQAAKKLSNDMTELKILRMEREEIQRLKKGKQTLEDATMKGLSEMENALRKASGQVDRANAAVRRLETENAEIKAEMEASKLSASESDRTCSQVAKREKKCMKKLAAWEKQRAQIQQEISGEKEKILEIQKELVRIKQYQKDAEVKWREELKAKEEASGLVEEEQRAKEAVEADNKRKLEALCLKIEIDFQRHKDDLLRLEHELSRLKASSHHQSNTSPASESKGQRETIAKLLQELDAVDDFSSKEVDSDSEICVICMKEEVSVVFLPCAHQVMCASCSDEYGGKANAACPCCHVPIEQRIRVFGASS